MAADPAVKASLVREEGALRALLVSNKQSQASPGEIARLLGRPMSTAEKKKVLDWYKAEIKFQNTYDAFQLKKLDYISDAVIQNAECIKATLSKVPLYPSKREAFKKALTALIQQRQIYLQNKKLFGTKEDYLRVLAYNRLYELQNAYVARVEEALSVDDSDTLKALDKLAEDLMSLPYFAKILYALNFERQSGQGETPILDALGEGVASLGRQWGVSVKWKGLENLPAQIYDGKTLNIVAFEHANSYLDTIAQAAIPKSKRKGLGFYGAAKYVFPESWVKSLEKSDHYIVVNQGKEVSRTLEIIGSRKLHGFLAAAEGLTPAGLYETRPVSGLFTDTYWQLKDEGLDINITPMSYPDNFRLYNHWKIKTQRPNVITGVVETSLSSDAADALYALTNDRSSIGIWLRSMWHKTLITDQNLLLSSPSLNALEIAVNQRLWTKITKKVPNACH